MSWRLKEDWVSLFGANRFCAIGKVVYSVCVPIALDGSGICWPTQDPNAYLYSIIIDGSLNATSVVAEAWRAHTKRE